jgi:EAL domain-containing protein (putative c-di-GMP-specific phosphodiesterase class I)
MIDVAAMRASLAAGEFFLEYSPIVSLRDGTCLGGEALSRWRRPDGVVMPDAFIPVAEGTPMAGELCYWVVETVAAELGDWLRANPDVSVSINVPPEILGRGGIRYAADKAGLSDLYRQLILEITERGVPDLIGLRALDDYARSGIRVAVDDVSRVSGANLALLSRAPLSVVKIDASLIAQIAPGSPAPEWLAGVEALIRTAGLTVIAEGVESDLQLQATRAAGIQAAQGYHFSRPLSAAALKAYWQQLQVSPPPGVRG